MNIIASGLRKGNSIKANQGYDMRFSKAKELNCKYRLFFRTVTVDGITDVVAPAVPGRKCDYDVMGTSFIQLDNSQVELDENGKFIDHTGLDTWSSICKVLHKAACVQEKRAKEAEYEATAKAAGTEINAAELEKALDAINAKYYGVKINNTNVAPEVQPILSNLTTMFFTQAIVVKLDATGAPIWKEAKRVTINLSGKAAQSLMKAADDKSYHQEGHDYIELGYDFIGADKKTAGQQASYVPIANSMALEVMFPDSWAAEGKAVIDTLANGTDPDKIGEQMIARAIDFRNKVSVADVISNLRKYCSTHAAVLTSIDMEDEATKWYAKDIVETGLVDKLPKIKEGLMELIKQAEAEKGTSVEQAAAKADEATNVAMKVMEDGSNTVSQFNQAAGGDIDSSVNGGVVDLSDL